MPATKPIAGADPIALISLDEIDATALPRDRATLDGADMTELRLSISEHGLRMPIEVFAFDDAEDSADDPHRYGLISGYRRLAAFRALFDLTGKDRYASIPAFIRAPASATEALTAMVEENAIRSDISPWEQAAIAVQACDTEIFETIDAAIQTLYVNFGTDKRRRLRAVATVIESLGDLLIDPEGLSLRRLLRIAAALTRNYGGLMRHALENSTISEASEQWQRLLPILTESETCDPVAPASPGGGVSRPRRTYDSARYTLRIRREMTRDGWALQFTGRDAQSWLLDIVFDHIEHLLTSSDTRPKSVPRARSNAIGGPGL